MFLQNTFNEMAPDKNQNLNQQLAVDIDDFRRKNEKLIENLR